MLYCTSRPTDFKDMLSGIGQHCQQEWQSKCLVTRTRKFQSQPSPVPLSWDLLIIADRICFFLRTGEGGKVGKKKKQQENNKAKKTPPKNQLGKKLWKSQNIGFGKTILIPRTSQNYWLLRYKQEIWLELLKLLKFLYIYMQYVTGENIELCN